MSLVLAAKAQAQRNVRNPDLWEVVREFFREEYRLPSTHEAFQNASLEDLLVEMFETRFRRDPISAHKNEDGRVQFYTGDPVLDKWEAEIAKGLSPDFTEAMTTQQIAAMREAEALVKVSRAAEARLQASQTASKPATPAPVSTWKQVHDAMSAAPHG